MTQMARERLREARAVASVARDLAHVIYTYLDDPELLSQPVWLHRVERLANRLKAEARRLEDTIYEARYYGGKRRADANHPAGATASTKTQTDVKTDPVGRK